MIGRVLNETEWRSYLAGYDFGTIPPARLVLHHTYRPNQSQWRGLASMRGMQNYYRSLGWSAAPHIYVAPDGIWLFTPMRNVGIHAGAGNSGVSNGVWWYSIGLEMVGYFDHRRPDGAVWNYAKLVMATISQRLGIAPRRLISFHRDYTNQKSCPGWAVTKDWVFAEVEATLNNSRPVDVPPGSIGNPSPTDEVLLDRFLHESFSRRGEGFNDNWAFHQFAVNNGMGMPLSRSQRLRVGRSDYAYQVFARDTLYNMVPRWGDVNRLSDLLGGSIPGSGLGRELLEASYRATDATFRADWAFHQFALAAGLGPAIGPSATLRVAGTDYAYQAFALDTLYNVVPRWSEVQQLSRLANTRDAGQLRLRDALLDATYRRGGASYNPGWAFHQLARKWNIGIPLSNPYTITIEGVVYNIQPYARDMLYNIVPNWGDVKRLSTLAAAQDMTLGSRRRSRSLEPSVLGASSSAEAPADAATLAAEESPPLDEEERAGVNWEPPADVEFAFSASRFAGAGSGIPVPETHSERLGSPVELIVLHGDPGPAEETLNRMVSFDTRSSTHYYITRDGLIYALVDEKDAAWHAGMATYRGQRININRISIGVVLERPVPAAPIAADAPADAAEDYNAQQIALGLLVKDVARRHTLPPAAVVRWHDLTAEHAPTYAHSVRPLNDIALSTLIGW
jgi:hypothetical protein